MPYWNKASSFSSPSLDSVSLSSRMRGGSFTSDEFYEIEPAIVLDIILDKDHEYFNHEKYKLIPDQWPVGIDGNAPSKNDLDYTWVGRALLRMVYSQKNVVKNDLVWALPLESNISEYPVVNEMVGVVFYLGKYYYTRKINTFNTPNANANFNSELSFGGFRTNQTGIVQGNCELTFNQNTPLSSYKGPISKLNFQGSNGFQGVLGRYFTYNPRIRSLKRREGDLIFESRFGQSIRFAAYDDDRTKDVGKNSDFSGYKDYVGNGVNNPYSGQSAGGGNPMLLIRNRQRPITSIVEEKNVGGYMLEDINNDGSSIHLTSGVTLSQFHTTCLKQMWGVGEEQSAFLPGGSTDFQFPKLMGDQIVINSDRIVISAKANEMFHYSKKRMSFVTDDEYTVDAHKQIVFTTNNKTVLNSPAIYLGEYDQTGEPVLLGQTSVNWMSALCDWLLEHTHWYLHTHPDAQGGSVGTPTPMETQVPVQIMKLMILQQNLQALLSRRVFVTGGGFAPGQDGEELQQG